MKIETKCLHSGYKPGNGDPRALPIYQSTTFTFDSTEYIGDLFDFSASAHFYSRLSNPTVAAVEDKIADLEGGIGALLTSSGQAATTISLLNILKSGDHFISSSTIYGGTYNLFNVTLRKLGIDVTFVDPELPIEELQKAVKPNTKAVFGETISNPTINVLDIEKFVKLAHDNNVPFIIDNTFATPVLLRPIEYGADIVIHSTTKYMDGHAIQVGGAIIDSGNFDWKKNGFTELYEPDESYHGLIYTEHFGKAAYIAKARAQMMRDYGMCQTANGAFLLNLGLETLPLRMAKHCENAEKVAEFFETRKEIKHVGYPTLKNDKNYELYKKYLPNGASGVIAIIIDGGKEKAVKFMDNLKLASNVVHVADIRTCVLHPASETHRQLSDEQLKEAGIDAGLIRVSVGLENIDDIIADFKQALDNI
ncbi:MAG: O-acetylhomoserine aminocarboxypropyltransferase/cysteine synthase [Ruminococcaceae bacterium]|nr:O-acetylhomoserine aminocarboxypropyltransferase/cysteine synthase [Oscillospiraceae bacterium]